jgi:ABC-type branched-subunit amino acid transport system ATPase component
MPGAVLLVEQNARYALATARRGYVLQTGAIIAAARERARARGLARPRRANGRGAVKSNRRQIR